MKFTLRHVILSKHAGLVYRYYSSFPSWLGGFDSRTLLHFMRNPAVVETAGFFYKPILLVCDNTVMVKKLPAIKELMKDAECAFPYDGAKEHYILDLESPQAKDVITMLEEITPVRKKKAKG